MEKRIISIILIIAVIAITGCGRKASQHQNTKKYTQRRNLSGKEYERQHGGME